MEVNIERLVVAELGLMTKQFGAGKLVLS